MCWQETFRDLELAQGLIITDDAFITDGEALGEVFVCDIHSKDLTRREQVRWSNGWRGTGGHRCRCDVKGGGIVGRRVVGKEDAHGAWHSEVGPFMGLVLLGLGSGIGRGDLQSMGARWWYRDDLRKLGKLEVDSHRDMGRGTERVSGYGGSGVVVGRYVAKVVVGSVGAS